MPVMLDPIVLCPQCWEHAHLQAMLPDGRHIRGLEFASKEMLDLLIRAWHEHSRLFTVDARVRAYEMLADAPLNSREKDVPLPVGTMLKAWNRVREELLMQGNFHDRRFLRLYPTPHALMDYLERMR